MKWLNDLKIAVIEENITKINKLIQQVPNFDEVDKSKEALSLLEASINIVKKEKAEILENMNKIRKTKEFLKN